MSYHELSVAERATIQISLLNRFSQRRIARLLNHSPFTISREIRRNHTAHGFYVTHEAQRFMSVRRQACRPHRMLGAMKSPPLEDAYVCRETIYNVLYVLPVGELRKELIICLR